MTRIRMVTEAVRQVAHGLSLGANELEDLPSDIKNLSENLSSAWQGGNAEHYAGEIRKLSGDLKEEIEDLQYLSSRLNNEVGEWENADRFDSSGRVAIGVTAAILTAGAALPIASQTLHATMSVSPKAPGPNGMISPLGTANRTKPFNWAGWGEGVSDPTLKLLSEMKYDSKVGEISYKGIGRALNTMAGGKKAGFVGFMNDAGHIIRNPIVSEGLPLGLGVVSDLSGGDSVGKALISEGAEFLIDKGLYAIPVVGQVYLGYQIGLGIGHLVSSGLEIAGMHEQAAAMQNTLEVLDISERLGDAVADFVLDPPKLPLQSHMVMQAQTRYSV